MSEATFLVEEQPEIGSSRSPSSPLALEAMKPMLAPLLFISVLLLLPLQALANCECTIDAESREEAKALQLKLIAIASILTSGALGVLIPILGQYFSLLSPEHDLFFGTKAFAAGVILATGLVHILPEAFDQLTSPCIGENPGNRYPFAGLIAMMSAMATMIVNKFVTSYYSKSHTDKLRAVEDGGGCMENGVGEHAINGQSRGYVVMGSSWSEVIRQRVISQVLDLGILVHSVINGISLGASENPSTIRPLVAALSFHQLFEGIGLGSCIVQANFRARATIFMTTFFSLTAPVGILSGIGISSRYDQTSSSALVVEGSFSAAAAGILIYMALVDLLAADFSNPRLQDNKKLLLWANFALILGAGSMSLLALWV